MTVVNPLDLVGKELTSESSNKELESTSSIDTGAKAGHCPKCSKPMGKAKLAMGLEVDHCIGCRVSSPCVQ